MTQFEQTEAWSRQRDQLRQVQHNFGSRVQYEDNHGSSGAAPPRRQQGWIPHGDRAQPPRARAEVQREEDGLPQVSP